MPITVVCDATVVVGALSQLGPAALSFPAVPPLSGADYADAIGVFARPDDYFRLILSDRILEEAATALATRGGLAWEFDQIDHALDALTLLAEQSGGGLMSLEMGVQVPPTFGTTAATALRTIAAKDLGFPRVMVTTDEAALRNGDVQPRGVPFPSDELVGILDPRAFARLAEKVRWKMRRG